MGRNLVYYFAYGSNMNPKRMIERNAEFLERRRAVLRGWKLVFNKIARRNPKEGYANIVRDEGNVVEGVLYQIYEEGLSSLDIYEGYPHDYDRKLLEVELEDGSKVKAWVYVAQPDKVREGLKPSREYLENLLKGCDLLSKEYCEKLRKVETL